MESQDPTPEFEGQFGPGSLDPASLSLNTVRGDALHAVIKYALWWRRYLETSPGGNQATLDKGFDELSEVRDVLERHLDSSKDPSLAVHSVFGQWFPWLVVIDSKWASKEVVRIFPLGADHTGFFWSAWGTYVVVCDAYTNVLPLLRLVYRAAIGNVPTEGAKRIAISEKPSEHPR